MVKKPDGTKFYAVCPRCNGSWCSLCEKNGGITYDPKLISEALNKGRSKAQEKSGKGEGAASGDQLTSGETKLRGGEA